MKTKAKTRLVDETIAACFADFSLKDAPGHLIRRAQQRHQDIFAEEVGHAGPTSRQFAVMLAICQRPGSTQSELVDLTGIDRSTLGDLMDRLVRRGHLERRRAANDGRANAVYATKSGRMLVTAALPGVIRTQARILDKIPRSRRRTALEILRLLADLA